MKKGISWYSLPQNIATEAKLKLTKDAGFDGIEVDLDDIDVSLEALVELKNKYKIEIPSLFSKFSWQKPLTSSDTSIRNITIAYISNQIKDAEFVGASTILVIPGVVTPEVTYETAIERSFIALNTILESTSDSKVKIGLENVLNKFLLSPLEFRDFIDRFKNQRLSCYFDVGNICFHGIPQHWIEYLGTRISQVHVKGFDDFPKTVAFPSTMKSDIDWKSVIASLKKINYSNYLTVEIKNLNDSIDQVFNLSKELDQIIDGSL